MSLFGQLQEFLSSSEEERGLSSTILPYAIASQDEFVQASQFLWKSSSAENTQNPVWLRRLGARASQINCGLERLWSVLCQVSPHTLRTKDFVVEMLTFIHSNRDQFGSIAKDNATRLAQRLRSTTNNDTTDDVVPPEQEELLEDLLEVGMSMMQEDCALWLEAKGLPKTVLDGFWTSSQVHQIQHIVVLEHFVKQFDFPRSSWHDLMYQALEQLETHPEEMNPTFIMDIKSTLPEGLRQSLADPQFWYVDLIYSISESEYICNI